MVGQSFYDEFRIRKLTPKECWRLMGFTDHQFLSAQTGGSEFAKRLMESYKNDSGPELTKAAENIGYVSNSQLYKQAGNSIVVDVLYYIYKNLFEAMPYLFENMKVGSYFSGIGAFESALDRLFADVGGGYELVNFCEFDKYAAKAYCAVHDIDPKKNLGDIALVDENQLEPFNFICGGSPCQDFSVAGKLKGCKWTCKDCGAEYNPLYVHYSARNTCPECGSENLDKTRSSLLVEWLRIIRANKPNWGVYENVKNIVGKNYKETFDLFLKELDEYGYNCHYKVLNAKDYGVPQNRERVYLIIIKKELDNGEFVFPEPFDNGVRLKDVLEDEVLEKFYVNTSGARSLIMELVDSGKLDDTYGT